MSREIKFRVWNGKRNLSLKKGFLWFQYTSFGYDTDNNSIFDDKLIVEQFTGLKDKNNKEVFEGDVVKISADPVYKKNKIIEISYFRLQNLVGVVRYWQGSYHVFGIGENVLFTLSALFHDDTECEVIGNIHENLDLLK